MLWNYLSHTCLYKNIFLSILNCSSSSPFHIGKMKNEIFAMFLSNSHLKTIFHISIKFKSLMKEIACCNVTYTIYNEVLAWLGEKSYWPTYDASILVLFLSLIFSEL